MNENVKKPLYLTMLKKLKSKIPGQNLQWMGSFFIKPTNQSTSQPANKHDTGEHLIYLAGMKNNI